MTMADQVVLLQKGRVEQTGRPHELYERPQTTFVAQFMGSPPMNLLKLEMIEERSALAAACGGSMPEARLTDGFVGVRPEHVRVGQRGLPVRVSATDYLGAETVLRMVHGGQILFGKIDGHRRYSPGELLHVSWSEEAVHRFGADGIRIEDPQRDSF
jgi:sn-glycerol 3-phosphate transport system ATP-binding protein